jgi:hypothetical protein
VRGTFIVCLGVIVVAGSCSGSTPPVVIKDPATLQAGCDVPDDRRVLRARLDIERGEGSITVDGQTGGPCAIFALTPGPHRVAIHAAGPAAFGVAAVLQAFSDGTAYDVFDLHCGFPGPCDTDTLHAWQSDVQAARTHMTDPCAALKVTAVHWDSEKLDAYHPKSLDVSFELHVYSKPSGKPPRDPSCPDR